MNISQANLELANGTFYIDFAVQTNGQKKVIYSKVLSTDGDLELEDKITEITNKYKTNSVLLALYRPNGSSKKFYREIEVSVQEAAPVAAASFLGNPAPAMPIAAPTTKGWEQYVIDDLKEKVKKLETETEQQKREIKTSEKTIVDLEKQIIEKNHIIGDLEGAVEAKSGLKGFMETASESPAMLGVLAKLVDKLIDGPAQSTAGNLAAPAGQFDETTAMYVQQFGQWMQNQPQAGKEAMWNLLMLISNNQQPEFLINQLINSIQHEQFSKAS